VTDELNAHLGLVVRRIRRNRELTQSQLADRIGLTRTSVTNIERGDQGISVALLVDLARGMDADPVDLLAQALRLKADSEAASTPMPSEIATGVASAELREWVLGMVQQDKSAEDPPITARVTGQSSDRESSDATVQSGTGGRR
jgi:transcriptional regulator with XRE-family HTH domain